MSSLHTKTAAPLTAKPVLAMAERMLSMKMVTRRYLLILQVLYRNRHPVRQKRVPSRRDKLISWYPGTVSINNR